MLSVTDSFNIDEDGGTRVAGIMYNSDIQSVPFDPFQNAAGFQARVRSLPYNFSLSFLDQGIAYARRVFTEEGRDGIPKILVIVRDGYSSLPPDTLRQSLIARTQNIAVVAIGVEGKNGGFPRRRQELQSISSTPGLFIGVRDFTELRSVGSELVTKLCGMVKYKYLQSYN